MSDDIRLETHDGVAVITIDYAASENTLTQPVIDGLRRTLDEVAADASVRAAVLTAAGHEAFIVGADPHEILAMDRETALRASRRGQALAAQIEALPMPTIAAVNGLAIGGGLEMMLACDLAIAASTATFWQLETSIALVPGFGGTYRLPRRIGLARARWMIYTAKAIDAATALDWGLVNEVVEIDRLGERAREVAATIAANDGPALALAKAALARGAIDDPQTALSAEAEAFAARAGTPELRNRVGAVIAARSAAKHDAAPRA